MKLYFTSNKQSSIQDKPEMSLGGYVSLSPIPNSGLSVMFGDLSQISLENLKEEYIACILKNEFEYAVNDIEVWFEHPVNSFCNMKLSAVTLNGEGLMESIQDRYSKPYYADFYSASGEENAVGIGNLNVGESVGLWISRSFAIELIREYMSSDHIVSDFLNSVILDTVEEVNMKINWSLSYGGPLGGENI